MPAVPRGRLQVIVHCFIIFREAFPGGGTAKDMNDPQSPDSPCLVVSLVHEVEVDRVRDRASKPPLPLPCFSLRGVLVIKVHAAYSTPEPVREVCGELWFHGAPIPRGFLILPLPHGGGRTASEGAEGEAPLSVEGAQ